MIRSGADYISSLNDGRRVFLDGDVITDVADHPAFREAARSVARYYDAHNEASNQDILTYEDSSGERYSRAYIIPRSGADLAARREAFRLTSELTYGLMGRNPDHVASFLAGWAGRADVFAKGGERFGRNVESFYEKARRENLYLTYAIVPPQIDRSKAAHLQADPHLYAGAVEDNDEGIVVRGAQQLGTGAVLADYIILSNIQPLPEGDEDQAISVAIPMNAPGVKIYARRGYAAASNSVFDYPLSTRFDETDALLVFDDVFVPWEQVFVFRNRAVCQAQWTETPAHLLGNHQAQVRLSTKLDFLMGLANRIAQLSGSGVAPPVRGMLGEMAALVSAVHGLVYGQEANAQIDEHGVAWPGPAECFALMTLQSEIYPRLMHMMRDLCGGGLIQLPSSVDDFRNPEAAADLQRYMSTPLYEAVDRVKILKLAWDLVGSEFGSRHHQYEMFYVGAPFIVRQRMFATYDFGRGSKLVDDALASYSMDGVIEPAGSLPDAV